MLTVTQRQMRMLEAAPFIEFAAELASYLTQAHPDAAAAMAEGALLEACRTHVLEGRALGLNEKRHLRIFVELAVLCGPRLFDATTVQSILNHPDVSADEKIAFLFKAAAAVDARRGAT